MASSSNHRARQRRRMFTLRMCSTISDRYTGTVCSKSEMRFIHTEIHNNLYVCRKMAHYENDLITKVRFISLL
jgi:hypothetical protein